MREEPTMGETPDLSNVRFRQETATPRPRPEPQDYTWQIGGGVFLGLTLFFVAYKVHDYYATKAAIAEFEKAIADLAAPDADPLGWRAQAAEANRQQAVAERRRAELERQRYELRPGERCINGQRFQRVENGWIQVNRPCR